MSTENNVNKKVNKDLILRERLAIERTIMTNNTTLLSFIRTSLYFSVAGLSLNNLLKVKFGYLIETACWIISAAILTLGIKLYHKQKQKIKDSYKHIGDYKLEYEAEED